MRSILITGASTGIGRAVAERLAATGAVVFAGVRSPKDADALRAAGANVVPVTLEVTDEASVAAARDLVRERTGGTLDALVNNAGIVVAGPLEMVAPADFRRQLDVNVVGPQLVAQAVLPMLRAARGRIVTIGSISGRFAAPYAGAYAASKHAVEALCDAMRVELAPFGVDVVLIEPGAVKTPLWGRTNVAADAAFERADAAVAPLYAAAIAKLRTVSARLEASGAEPDVVARTVEAALAARRPKTRYLVGTDAKVQAVLRLLPDRVRDRLLRSMFAA